MLISVDLETTGLIPGRHGVIEIGAAVVEPGAPRCFQALVAPFCGAEFDPEAMAVNKIDPRALETEAALPPAVAWKKFAEWVRWAGGEDRPYFCGWNSAFDWGFVRWHLDRYGIALCPFHHRVVELRSWAAGVLGARPDEMRSELIAERLGVRFGGEHRALPDALDGSLLALALLDRSPK